MIHTHPLQIAMSVLLTMQFAPAMIGKANVFLLFTYGTTRARIIDHLGRSAQLRNTLHRRSFQLMQAHSASNGCQETKLKINQGVKYFATKEICFGFSEFFDSRAAPSVHACAGGRRAAVA
jgi:hypothetical protein